MTMAPAPQDGVFGATSRIMLHGDSRPMVHGVGKPVMAGLPPDDDAAFARSLGDGRDSGQAAQRGVVAPLQGIPSLCEQRGEDDPSHSRQGCEELHVMLLCLPRLILCGRNEFCCQDVELAIGLLKLPIHKADARDKARNVRAGGFSRSGGDLQRRFAQHVQNMRCVEAPDAIAFQDLGDRSFADAPRFGGRGRQVPQVEHGGKVAPKLLAHAVGEPIRSSPSSPAIRDHSRSSITVGSALASSRKQRRSVRKADAIVSASRLSSLAPAIVKRSRKRSNCFGLIE